MAGQRDFGGLECGLGGDLVVFVSDGGCAVGWRATPDDEMSTMSRLWHYELRRIALDALAAFDAETEDDVPDDCGEDDDSREDDDGAGENKVCNFF